MGGGPSGTPTPAKPADFNNGSFAPQLHDQPITQTVLGLTLTADHALTASITAGMTEFKVEGIVVYDLVLKAVDPSTLPAGSPPQKEWDLENPTSSDGLKPLHAKKGQRVMLAVTASVPDGAIPPGSFTGTVVLQGGSFSQTVSLQGTYLGVDHSSLIGEKWASLGGEAFLGPVLTNAHLAADGRGTVQEFGNGALYQVPTTTPLHLGDFKQRVAAMNAVRAGLVSPSSSSPADNSPAYSVSFASGATVSVANATPSTATTGANVPPSGSHTVNIRPEQAATLREHPYRLSDFSVFYLANRLYKKWLSLSGKQDALGNPVWKALGYPVEDTFATLEKGQAVRFENGIIVARFNPWDAVLHERLDVDASRFQASATTQAKPAGNFPGNLTGTVAGKFAGNIGRRPATVTQPPATPPAGNQDSAKQLAITGAAVSGIQANSVASAGDQRTFVVYGAIYGRYAQIGDLSDPKRQPFLGLPTSDEQAATRSRGRVSHFDGGDIYWAQNVGAHEVHGAIRQHWLGLGGAGGFLGFPMTDETGTPDGVGRYNRFEGGMIYWTGTTGAWEVQGAILDKWDSLGAERGYLGYPVSDEMDITLPFFTGPGRVSYFQFGEIIWSGSIGAIDVPQTFSTPPQPVLTPSGTALGGSVTFNLWSNGDYRVDFHMHDSGLPDYDFQVTAVFTTSNGLSLAATHGGHVEGTVSWTPWHDPNRDNDYSATGNSAWVQTHWVDVPGGRLWVTKDYSATGVIGFFEDLAKGIFDIAVGATGLAVGIVVGLGSEVLSVFGDLGLGGAVGLIAGTVVFAFGGGIALAVVAGIGVGLVTNAMIKQRQISDQEYAFADAQVFLGQLPPLANIYLTNLTGLGGKAFTIPGADGNIYVNFGEGYDDPLNYKRDSYQTKGQLLVHELTHAWQIHHASFLPGLMCNAVVAAADKQVGQSVYQYGPPGPDWGDFGTEQQGAIVDQWFAGTSTPVVPYRTPQDIRDPYFRYIRDNIQKGVT